MNQIHLPDNLIRMRHKRNITQEQLADFLGVTKASVSKWENHQSMPDILLLPKLAAFFDVSIDQLMGYEPQLSKEQIQKVYQDLSEEFVSNSFTETMKKSQELVKKYYSCYPFLLQICVLWINHFMLPEDREEQQKILNQTEQLCEHIIQICNAVNICNDAIALKALVGLQMGKAQEAVEALEDLTDPMRISGQNDLLLIQAYQMIGDNQKANDYTQITMYTHLMALVGASIQYLAVNMANEDSCQETIRRMETILHTYEIDSLHPNISAQFYYQSALVNAFHGKQTNALAYLREYAKMVTILFEMKELKLHGDHYFDRLDQWIEQLTLGGDPPRSQKMLSEHYQETLNHPLFVSFQDNQEFQELKNSLSQEHGRNQK